MNAGAVVPPTCNFSNIPHELQVVKQWVNWRAVGRENYITKRPLNPRTLHAASVTDSQTWGAFDDAVAAFMAGKADGIGFVFTEDDPYVGIDIDDEAKVAPELRAQRREIVRQIFDNTTSYAEISPSGKGTHIIAKAKLCIPGRRSTALQLEFYSSGRYFTMTGDIIDDRRAITVEQKAAERFVQDMPQKTITTAGVDLCPTTDAFRRLNMSDDAVVEFANNIAGFIDRYNNNFGDWSEAHRNLVGDLDKISGDPEQVRRIVRSSPLVQLAATKGGETRAAKSDRVFVHHLTEVRAHYAQMKYPYQANPFFIAHGREQWENVQRARAERARVATETLLKAERAINSNRVLDAFPMLDRQHRELTRPPGVGGEFVAATEKACYHPYTPFAIPATLTSLAGIIGRGYKLPDGKGVNLNFILAAATGAGKTQTMDAWRGFVADAAQATGNDLAGPSRQRIIQNGTMSIHGIFEDFMRTPSLTWMIEECAAQLHSMAKASTTVETQLRDSYNELYDCGRHNKFFTLPRSMSTKKANFDPINNLSVSTFWTTAVAKFEVSNGDALDGFLSRVSIIRHSGASGERQRRPQVQLSKQLHECLVNLLRNAKRLDETYSFNPFAAGSLLTHISTSTIDDVKWEILTITDKVREASIRGDLPETYVALSRLPITAERIAGVLAVLENPYNPAITIEQYLWAFGYLLQNATSILADMDSGELGAKASDETLAVVRTLRRELSKYKKPPSGIPRGDLRRRLVDILPFSKAKGYGRTASKWATETIDHMLKEGMLTEVEQRSTTVRPKKLLCPTDDPIWRL